MKKFRDIVKFLFNKFGYEINRLQPTSDSMIQLITIMKKININLIFDIGANEGQFSLELRRKGYKGQIVSFEPLTSAYTKILKISKKENNWIVHNQCAIGDYNGEVTINISKNSVSSSILSIKNSHLNAAPASSFISKEKIPIHKLDDVSKKYLTGDKKFFIKIDTQGFEWEVINGATNTIQRAHGIICELSLVPLYDNQRLWRDIIDRLNYEGFILWAIQKGFTDQKTGQSLQMDAIFVRKDEI